MKKIYSNQKESNALHLKDIRHYYGDTKVLDIDDLEIEKGSITGLIGPNGSGKSTLLKLLAFTEQPSEGNIFYKGVKESMFSSSIRSKITLLTQTPYLLKRTVFENVAYGLKIKGDNNRINKKVEEALGAVGLDSRHFAHRKWHELSGGEAQRVAMAARLILKPEVLLLDEPVASVDTESAELIRKASLKARDILGTTLVIASHDLQWLYSISEKQLSIFKGRIFLTGMENIITGPFDKTRGGTLTKRLGDGQTLRLKCSDHGSFTGVIRKKHISIGLKPEGPYSRNRNQLSGHVVSLILGSKRFQIMTTIAIHDISFVLSLSPEDISRLDLYPGKNVTLRFNATDVEWLQA